MQTITAYNRHCMHYDEDRCLWRVWSEDLATDTAHDRTATVFMDVAEEEIQRRVDIDIARDRKERGIIAPFQAAW